MKYRVCVCISGTDSCSNFEYEMDELYDVYKYIEERCEPISFEQFKEMKPNYSHNNVVGWCFTDRYNNDIDYHVFELHSTTKYLVYISNTVSCLNFKCEMDELYDVYRYIQKRCEPTISFEQFKKMEQNYSHGNIVGWCFSDRCNDDIDYYVFEFSLGHGQSLTYKDHLCFEDEPFIIR